MSISEQNTTTSTGSPLQAPVNKTRIHYLDHVRALAMLLGVFFHAAFSYAEYTQSVWLATDTEKSFTLEVFIWFGHLFRMALFFLIAGFFANLMVQKRGAIGFLKNRALRLGLPFFIFMPLNAIAIIALLVYATGYIQNLNEIQQIVADAIRNETPNTDAPRTGVLWFVYNLMYFSVIAVILQKVNISLVARLRRWVFSSAAPLVFLPLFLVPALYYAGLPLASPELFTPEMWSYGYYGIFFLFGWHFFYHTEYLDLVSRHLNKLVATVLFGYPVFFYLMPQATVETAQSLTFGEKMAFDATKMLAVCLEAYLSVYLTLIALVLGRRFFDAQNHIARYISDASYWVYLVHLPFVFYFQIILTEVDLPVWIKYFITSGATLVIAFVTYHLVVRYTPLGTMLNGKKYRHPNPAVGEK